MVFKGHIEKGQVVLDDEADLPEGAAVAVELLTEQPRETLHPDIQRFTAIIPPSVDALAEHRYAVLTKHI